MWTAKDVVGIANLLTAKQVIIVYNFAGMTKDLLPRKGKATILSPVGKVFYRITWDARKGTYGDRLYLCEHCQFPEGSNQ